MKLPPPGDQEEFYETLLQSSRGDAESAVVMLLWRTGMHASTLCEGNWGTVNFKEVQWCRPKTRKLLTATLPEREGRLIVRCKRAGSLPNTQRALRWRLGRIGERAGYPGITPLTLRHSRAIYLLDSGMSGNRVAACLGCSWQVLEKHYAQIEAARLVE